MGITRNEDGSLATVPAALLDLVPIFGVKGTHFQSIQELVDRLGEDLCNRLVDYAEQMAGLTARDYITLLAEGWYSENPILPVIDLLEKVDGRVAYRAAVAQRIGHANAVLAGMLSPFYSMASGIGRPPSKNR